MTTALSTGIGGRGTALEVLVRLWLVLLRGGLRPRLLLQPPEQRLEVVARADRLEVLFGCDLPQAVESPGDGPTERLDGAAGILPAQGLILVGGPSLLHPDQRGGEGLHAGGLVDVQHVP